VRVGDKKGRGEVLPYTSGIKPVSGTLVVFLTIIHIIASNVAGIERLTVKVAWEGIVFGLCSVLRPLQHSIGYMGDGRGGRVQHSLDPLPALCTSMSLAFITFGLFSQSVLNRQFVGLYEYYTSAMTRKPSYR